jgi:hypothetical protein
MALQRNRKLARPRLTANKGSRQKSAVLLDTRLSSSPFLANSTRHSVTSRIQRNSLLPCYLTFSTRHLNATLVKRNLVEKFNTSFRSWNFDLQTRVLEPLENPPGPKVLPMSPVQSVTNVSGLDPRKLVGP